MTNSSYTDKESRSAIFMWRGKNLSKIKDQTIDMGWPEDFQHTYIEPWPSSLNVPGILRRTINFGQTIEINRTRLGARSVILSIRAWRTRYTSDSLWDRKSTSKIYLLNGVSRRGHEHDDESALFYRRTNKRTCFLRSSSYEPLSSSLKWCQFQQLELRIF